MFQFFFFVFYTALQTEIALSIRKQNFALCIARREREEQKGR